ncbi:MULTISPECIES: hypothetical protein [Leisingera]|jgi:hypothetical protein|uniref:Uncharacterized protein n=1 Tax=Leisingera aquaemixtae TaxID=1396826 RepID=A0ABY5WK08_9RHOB|nr:MULTISPECIES: hypothetical protein [Leisingera]QDI77141.1 hypothetical protein R2C4_15745 [Leisingera aquaemixtae]UWQ41817.1 hypothetical protein K3718_01620 [Leisingera aquaemixtae]
MTRTDIPAPIQDPQAALAQILADLGLRRTVAAIVRHLLSAQRPPRKAGRTLPLSNYIRQDIGLPPLPEELPSSRGYL